MVQFVGNVTSEEINCMQGQITRLGRPIMKVTNDHTHARTSMSTISGQQPENQKHHPRLPQP